MFDKPTFYIYGTKPLSPATAKSPTRQNARTPKNIKKKARNRFRASIMNSTVGEDRTYLYGGLLNSNSS